MKLESTQDIKEANEIVIALRSALPQIMQQSFWQQKVSVAEKISYLKELAVAKRILWQITETVYPQVKGKIYSVGSLYVECKEIPETSELTPSLP